jgi:hypothetical protein
VERYWLEDEIGGDFAKGLCYLRCNVLQQVRDIEARKKEKIALMAQQMNSGRLVGGRTRSLFS